MTLARRNLAGLLLAAAVVGAGSTVLALGPIVEPAAVRAGESTDEPDCPGNAERSDAEPQHRQTIDHSTEVTPEASDPDLAEPKPQE
ncbi:hypothetical protein [Nocardia transvalensis]|uniref:hypothetical protein n=1 Tax=Nocardia transvalensis TaxID=37333 RepID=UPI001893271E|nr:hypothetical protein [Nocardia transvalensis]MBF6328216.1 hypothetical protein [Nocardia transvalensis]